MTTDRRSLLLTAPGELEWVHEALSPPGGGEILVRTTTGAVSVGSELPAYRGTERDSSRENYPVMTGYESLGTVLRLGPGVEGVGVGDRVVCFYGHRTHAKVPEEKAIPVPPGIPDGQALLSTLTCDVAKGVRRLRPLPEEPVLVSGAGAIGLLSVFVLRAYGVRDVDVIEPLASRRRLALRLGARTALSPREAAGMPAAYPAALECSGRDEAFGVLQESLLRGGRVCVLADGNVEPLTLSPAFHEQELEITGSSDGWGYHRHARWYFGILRERPEQAARLEEVFDLRISYEDLPSVFEEISLVKLSPVKPLVLY